MIHDRRLPIGAEACGAAGVHFRVWAPKCQRVAVALETGSNTESVDLQREPNGYFAGIVPQARVGMRYGFRLDAQVKAYPDPASRFQPEGPHGPSQVIDPRMFAWTDESWRGRTLPGQVVYEMHVGTFTREGTWAAAARELPELAALGITVIEVMPVSEFPGRFGWGYDGVDLFAPTRLYGTPDDFRHFVNAAHVAGIGVILDVVYNHLGPDGNYLGQFADSYFSQKYANEWGDAINFDGAESAPVREFFIANARYWIDEFHLDGLRLDATQQIFDDSPVNVIAEIVGAVRAAARGRATIIIGENEPQDPRLIRPIDQGGYGLDALWNDDFHHSAMVAMTGRNEAYYSDYLGTPQEFISAVKWGYLYQGQYYHWQKKRRGRPSLDLAPAQLVIFTQNHDQIANSGSGQRCHRLSSPGRAKAMTALLLLAPGTPMLFQGQEFGASTPFFYFADHNPELAKLVHQGRIEFLSQFRSLAAPDGMTCLPDPHDPQCFERCKLDFGERQSNRTIYDMHRDLLRLRREHAAFLAQRPRAVDGAVLGPEAFVLRFFSADGQDRLLLVNFGRDLHLDPAPEPLLAPPAGQQWAILWSSDDPRYGGCGTALPETEENWRITGEAALVLGPTACEPSTRG